MQIDFDLVKSAIWMEVIRDARNRVPAIFAGRVWDAIWRQIDNPIKVHIINEILGQIGNSYEN
jgi:hypothetical protein